MNVDKKLTILNMIKEPKEILFGAFSSTITKQDKANAWKRIFTTCQAFRLIKDGRDFTYLRDVFWPNLRKSTLRAVSAETLSSSPNNNMDSSDGGASKTCHSRTPCGWAVYTPFTRTVDYFMKNTCVCSKGKACLRTDDDLSVSAYVYRCRVEASPSEADTEPPT